MSEPTRAQQPAGVNHLVLNVADIERSHQFWTEMMGFEFVSSMQLGTEMRFYRAGPGHHHDVAIVQVKEPPTEPAPNTWKPSARKLGVNHIAIAYPDSESFVRQLEHLQSNGVAFHMRGNHGMTHSAYIVDPDGNGIEVLYELPSEVWEGDLARAMVHFETLPKEGPESLVDDTNYPRFEAHDEATEAAATTT